METHRINSLQGAANQEAVNKFMFSAFDSNSLFGGSSSVQPNSLLVLPCIKI